MKRSSKIDLGTAAWRKSSYSNAEGADCVEIAEGFVGAANWRKSSYSNGDGADCVEMADNVPGLVPVRDSKAGGDGPAIVIPAAAWGRFVAAVKTDTFTL